MGKEAFNKEKEKVAQELKSSQLESSDALPDNIKISPKELKTKKSRKRKRKKLKNSAPQTTSENSKSKAMINYQEFINMITLAQNKTEYPTHDPILQSLNYFEQKLNCRDLASAIMAQSNDNYEIEIHTVQHSQLPTIKGKYIDQSGNSTDIQLIPDTGCSFSCISAEVLKGLGYDMKDLVDASHFYVKTVNGKSQPMGTARLKIYLFTEKGDLYYIVLTCLVLADNFLDKILLSFKDLFALNCQWDLKSENPTLTIDCTTPGTDKPIRRAFKINAPTMDRLMLAQINFFREQLNPDESSAESDDDLSSTCSYNHHLSDNGYNDKKYIYECDYLSSHELAQDLGLLDCCHTSHSGNQCHQIFSAEPSSNTPDDTSIMSPEEVKTLYYTERTLDDYGQCWLDSSDKPTVIEEQAMNVANHPIDHCIPFSILEKDIINQQSLINDDRPIDHQDRITPETESKIGQNTQTKPREDDIQKAKSKFPELVHLDKDQAQKFNELFEQYSNVFSNNSMDIGSINFPPVHLEYQGKPVYDKPRNLSEDQFLLVQHAVDQLIESGVVEECSNQSLWNSNMMLVSSSSDEGHKRISTTLADTKTQAERLEILKQGWRVVSDLRTTNRVLKNRYGSMSLPSWHGMLAKHYKKFRSQIDLRKAFYHVSLSKESSDIFTFRVRNRCFRYLKLPMGYLESPNIFCDYLALILSEASFLDFQKEHPVMKNLTFTDCLLSFVDDITLLTDECFEQHLCLWKYLLQRFSMFNLKLNGSKCKVISPKGDLLGYAIDTTAGTYHLSSERTQQFSQTKPPQNRQQLISLLSTFNYYRDLCPSLKLLAMHLLLLAKTKKIVRFTKVHYKEFFMIIFLLKAQIHLNVPSMLRPLYVCVDSSHTSYSCALFQYLPEHEKGLDKIRGATTRTKPNLADRESKDDLEHRDQPNNNSFLRPYDNADPELDEITANRIEEWSNGSLKLCALSSKSYLACELLAGISRKELFAVIESLRSFESLIINCAAPTFVLTDCVAIVLLARLKHSNSKFFGISNYLQSFRNVTFVHSKGRYFSHLVDMISKAAIGQDIPSTFGLSISDLESLPNIPIPENSIMDSKDLYSLLTSPVPSSYSDLAARRKIKFHELASPSELLRKFYERPPEASLLKLLHYGPASINSDDVIFKRSDGKKPTKTQMRLIETKHQYPMLRKILSGDNDQCKNFMEGLPCESQENSQDNSKSDLGIFSVQDIFEVSCYSDNAQQEINEFSRKIKLFLEREMLQDIHTDLYQMATKLSLSQEITGKQLDFLLQYYFDSSLVNFDSKFSHPEVEFIRVKHHDNNDFTIGRDGDDSTFLYLKQNQIIGAKDAINLSMSVHFESLYEVELISTLSPNLIFHCPSQSQGPKTEFVICLIYNQENSEVELDTMHPVCRIRSTNQDEEVKMTLFTVSPYGDSIYDKVTYQRIELSNITTALTWNPCPCNSLQIVS